MQLCERFDPRSCRASHRRHNTVAGSCSRPHATAIVGAAGAGGHERRRDRRGGCHTADGRSPRLAMATDARCWCGRQPRRERLRRRCGARASCDGGRRRRRRRREPRGRWPPAGVHARGARLVPCILCQPCTAPSRHREGAIQFFIVSQRGALHYRYAIQAHPATVVGMCLRPHPVCDKQVDQAPVPPVIPQQSSTVAAARGGGGARRRSDGPWTSVTERASQLVGGNSSPPLRRRADHAASASTQEVGDDLLISVSDGRRRLAQLCSAVFAYDLVDSTPPLVVLLERVTAVATEELGVGALRRPPSGASTLTMSRLFLERSMVVPSSLRLSLRRGRGRARTEAASRAALGLRTVRVWRQRALRSALHDGGVGGRGGGGRGWTGGTWLIDVHARPRATIVPSPLCATARRATSSARVRGTARCAIPAARGLQRSTTRLLGRLVSGPSRPVGAVISLHAVESPSAGAKGHCRRIGRRSRRGTCTAAKSRAPSPKCRMALSRMWPTRDTGATRWQSRGAMVCYSYGAGPLSCARHI